MVGFVKLAMPIMAMVTFLVVVIGLILRFQGSRLFQFICGGLAVVTAIVCFLTDAVIGGCLAPFGLFFLLCTVIKFIPGHYDTGG